MLVFAQKIEWDRLKISPFFIKNLIYYVIELIVMYVQETNLLIYENLTNMQKTNFLKWIKNCCKSRKYSYLPKNLILSKVFVYGAENSTKA